jgi:nucleotide-binding universal stress UspA family protein
MKKRVLRRWPMPLPDMFNTILIPLDGSELAEAALPAATAIAKHADPVGELVLVRVAPDLWFGDAFTPEQAEGFQARMKHDCQTYLDGVAERLRKENLCVTVLVASGEPVEQILEVATIAQADLVAIATHGRSGLQRLMLGSVADKVIHRASIPVLLVRPTEAAHAPDQKS